MTQLTNEIVNELLSAMDNYKSIAQILIDKLITETNQTEKTEIEKGNYYQIENADLINEKENSLVDWYYNVHGEHCLFTNYITGQTLEVSLGDKDSIGDLDPYFFYNFLETTDEYKYLIKYFDQPFSDTYKFFEDLVEQKKMECIYDGVFRKL